MTTDTDNEFFIDSLPSYDRGRPHQPEISRGGDAPTLGTGHLDAFRMRCPSCRKLYTVKPGALDASGEGLAKFECSNCQTAFYALKPEHEGLHFLQTGLIETQFAALSHQVFALPTIDGFAESDVKGLGQDLRTIIRPPLVMDRECPNCLASNLSDASECRTCEIVFAQFRPGVASAVVSDVELSESADLVMMWQSLQDNYQNLTQHEAFVRRCHEEGRLSYAAHKYAQILVVAPSEELARKMRSRVIGLSSYSFDARADGLSRATWSFPLPSFNSFIILLGTVLVVVGFGFPHATQSAGLGFAMIALAIGLRFFLRRPRT